MLYNSIVGYTHHSHSVDLTSWAVCSSTWLFIHFARLYQNKNIEGTILNYLLSTGHISNKPFYNGNDHFV